MELTLSSFFFDLPIYTPVKIDESNFSTYIQIIDVSRSKEFEGYNPLKQIESTFKVTTDLLGYNQEFFGHGTVLIKCKRTDDIFRFYVFVNENEKTITKIGQYPSVADFHISEIKHYKKVIPQEKLRELTKAIGLAANGVGIGSFVYLRRLFEYLIYAAYEQCLSEDLITEEQFNRSRMDQKIELLSSHLPSFLVENRSMYSILSLGIHELDEQTCLAHFDTLRVGIEIILDEKLDAIKKQQKIDEAKRKLSQLKVSAKPS